MSSLRRFALGGVLLLTVTFAGCAGSVTYRSYDPYYHDYHVWADTEVPYYNSWVIESHHPKVEYRRLNKHDRESYWRWRHDHH